MLRSSWISVQLTISHHFSRFRSALGAGANSQPPVMDVIFFAVGGGSYLEYSNLKTVVEEVEGGTNVFYGSTEMTNSNKFIDEIVKML